jgi:hypothetical protein
VSFRKGDAVRSEAVHVCSRQANVFAFAEKIQPIANRWPQHVNSPGVSPARTVRSAFPRWHEAAGRGQLRTRAVTLTQSLLLSAFVPEFRTPNPKVCTPAEVAVKIRLVLKLPHAWVNVRPNW